MYRHSYPNDAVSLDTAWRQILGYSNDIPSPLVEIHVTILKHMINMILKMKLKAAKIIGVAAFPIVNNNN